MNESISIEKTRSGRFALWVGGGATSKKFHVRIVLRKGELPPPLFIRTSGYLSNTYQTLVGIQKGDIIVELSGRRPASPDNPDIYYLARKVVDFGQDEGGNQIAYCDYIDIPLDTIPAKVWRGADTYHNRDGRFFVSS